MDQKKTGGFLKELRKEKGMTQEQLAEAFGVSGRTISRWETGSNMPDLDLVIEIANYFEVTIEEFLDGERKEDRMNQKNEETLLKVAEYENQERVRVSRRLCGLFIAAIAAFVVYGVIDYLGLASTGIYEIIASVALGFVFGILMVGALFTSRYATRVQAAKQRLFYKAKNLEKSPAANRGVLQKMK